MSFYKMIGSKDEYDQHYDAQTGKKYIHPVFAQQIDLECVLYL